MIAAAVHCKRSTSLRRRLRGRGILLSALHTWCPTSVHDWSDCRGNTVVQFVFDSYTFHLMRPSDIQITHSCISQTHFTTFSSTILDWTEHSLSLWFVTKFARHAISWVSQTILRIVIPYGSVVRLNFAFVHVPTSPSSHTSARTPRRPNSWASEYYWGQVSRARSLDTMCAMPTTRFPYLATDVEVTWIACSAQQLQSSCYRQ